MAEDRSDHDDASAAVAVAVHHVWAAYACNNLAAAEEEDHNGADAPNLFSCDARYPSRGQGDVYL